MEVDLSGANVDILESILVRLSKEEIVRCRKVCRKWRTLIDSCSFWIAKEEFDGSEYTKSLVQSGQPLLSSDFIKLSVLRPFNRNLLLTENASGRTEYAKHSDPRWFFSNGGQGWRYETPPSFLGEHFDPEFKPLFDSCLVTSYGLCSKTMDLNMSELGIDDKILDEHRPPIIFTEWVSNRSDCGSLYKMKLCFYDENGLELASEEEDISFDQWSHQLWRKMEVVLKSYPKGCRILRVYSASRDTQFWASDVFIIFLLKFQAGHYGAKIAGSELVIKMDSSPPPVKEPDYPGESRFKPME